MKRVRWVGKCFVLVPIILVGFAMGAWADETAIAGIIQKTEDGIVIKSANGEEFVIFNQDLTNMVGKSVMLTGAVEEGPYGKSIRVETVQRIGK